MYSKLFRLFLIRCKLSFKPSLFMFFKGLVYTITDVPDLCDWIKKHFMEHPLFGAVSDDELVKMNSSQVEKCL